MQQRKPNLRKLIRTDNLNRHVYLKISYLFIYLFIYLINIEAINKFIQGVVLLDIMEKEPYSHLAATFLCCW